MSPRKYDMGKRAAAAEETRRRIVDAAHQLHIEQGVAATSWDDIAERAGVGVGTVYRHFPSLDELVPACGAVVSELIALPPAEAIAAAFDGADDRIETLVREVFAIYERAAPEVRVTLAEPHVHPAVQHGAEAFEATLGALIDAAAIGGDRRLVRALLDLATWESLRRQGLGPEEAVEAVTGLLGQRSAAH
jgi:AcrR family transcriptional regulator